MLATLTVSNTDDGTVTGLNQRPGTLRQAVFDANFLGGPDIIRFDANLSGAAINLTSGELLITDAVTIEATTPSGVPLASPVTINVQHNSRIFEIQSADVALNGLTLTGGNVGDYGGAIYAATANLTISNSTIIGNAASLAGGGVLASGGSLTLDGCTVSDNHADQNQLIYGGGGIFVFEGNLNLLHSTVSANTADNQDGGGVFFKSESNHSLVIDASAISGNLLARRGGGLFAEITNGSATITNSKFSLNETHGEYAFGAGVNLTAQQSLIVFADTTLSDNHAFGLHSNAGGMLLTVNQCTSALPNAPGVLLERLTVIGNRADDDSGGLEVSNNASVVKLVQCSISLNEGADNDVSGGSGDGGGGGLVVSTFVTDSLSQTAATTVDSCTINDNRTIQVGVGLNPDGGGCLVDCGPSSVTTFVNTTISGNHALGRGGGVMIGTEQSGGAAIFKHCTITLNQADANGSGDSGGGVYRGSSATTVTFDHTIVAGNLKGTVSARSDIQGNVTASWSLIGDNSGSNLTANPTANMDNLIGSGGIPVSAGLGVLADNGGPTKTHALLAGSAAIDRGDPALSNAPATDQRGAGFARKFNVPGVRDPGDFVDIGAYEVNPPKVIDVIISKTGANQTLNPDYRFAVTHAAGPVIGSGRQLTTVPVGGADTISIRFSEAMQSSTVQNSLSLSSIRLNATIPSLAASGGFIYDSGTQTATWKFTSPLPTTQYALTVRDGATSATGAPLDGEWTNPKQLYASSGAPTFYASGSISKFPSGNGAAGGDFDFVFTNLAADFNLTNSVDSAEWAIWYAHWGQNGGFVTGDADGSGVVDSSDILVIQQQQGYVFQVLWHADLNGDHVVDGADLAILNSHFGSGTTPADGDVDRDGDVDGNDVLLLQRQLGFKFA